MRALVVYESMYGNTHTIADRIADGLRPTFDTTVASTGEATAELIASADMLVVGGPTHAHSLTRASTRKTAVDAASKKHLKVDPSATGPGLREWLASCGANPRTTAVAFDTRVSMPVAVTGRAGRGVTRRLQRCGFSNVRDAGSFLVDKNNELLPGEAERAVSWARTFVSQL